MTEQATEITGTFRNDLEIGHIIHQAPVEIWGEIKVVTFRVIRAATEQEYRDKYNYSGKLPIDGDGRIAKFYEIVALD